MRASRVIAAALAVSAGTVSAPAAFADAPIIHTTKEVFEFSGTQEDLQIPCTDEFGTASFDQAYVTRTTYFEGPIQKQRVKADGTLVFTPYSNPGLTYSGTIDAKKLGISVARGRGRAHQGDGNQRPRPERLGWSEDSVLVTIELGFDENGQPVPTIKKESLTCRD